MKRVLPASIVALVLATGIGACSGDLGDRAGQRASDLVRVEVWPLGPATAGPIESLPADGVSGATIVVRTDPRVVAGAFDVLVSTSLGLLAGSEGSTLPHLSVKNGGGGRTDTVALLAGTEAGQSLIAVRFGDLEVTRTFTFSARLPDAMQVVAMPTLGGVLARASLQTNSPPAMPSEGTKVRFDVLRLAGSKSAAEEILLGQATALSNGGGKAEAVIATGALTPDLTLVLRATVLRPGQTPLVVTAPISVL